MNATTKHRSPRAVLGDVHALGRCFLLLSLLVLLLLVGPFFPHGPSDAPPLLLRVLDALILIAAVFALSSKRWTLLVAGVLALPALATHLGSQRAGAGDGLLDVLRIPSGMLFNLFACILIMMYSVRSGIHVRHRLSGAASAYLLMGYTFASVFALLDNFAGPALSFNGQPATNLSWIDLQYFSFSTLSTVGYGDFAPRLPLARSLAALEAITGVLFVTVFISALVSESVALKSTAAHASDKALS